MIRYVDFHHKTLQGLRASNEDAENHIMNLKINGGAVDDNMAPIDFFVICDGHGGKGVAILAVKMLTDYFMKKNLKYPLTQNYIVKIFNTVQKKIIEYDQELAYNCGCTAIVLVRFMNKYGHENIQVINLGDCRAVLSRKGMAVPLSKDHKPFWPEEKLRIDQVNAENNTNEEIHFDAGDWRIGNLSVSRSFGDLDNKPFVTHVPELFGYRLLPTDEFIIMACDGLWDVLENHEAVNFVNDYLKNNNIEYYNIPYKFNPITVRTKATDKFKNVNVSRALAEYAIARGSTDNVSVFIIVFNKKQ